MCRKNFENWSTVFVVFLCVLRYWKGLHTFCLDVYIAFTFEIRREKIEDLTRVVISYEIYETSLGRVS